MLQLVDDVGEEAFDALASGARDVEDAHTCPLVESDREEDDPERGDDDGDVHRDDRRRLTDPVTELVLARGGVDAESDSQDGAEDGGADHQLARDPHAIGDLVVHGLADGALPPVPAEEDATEPGPPALEERDGVAQVERLQHPRDLIGSERRAATDVVAPRIEERPGQEVGHVGRDHDHQQPAECAAHEILDQGVDSLSVSDALGNSRRNSEPEGDGRAPPADLRESTRRMVCDGVLSLTGSGVTDGSRATSAEYHHPD